MGSTVSLPEPYSCFPLLSVGDVDRVIHKHRDECEGDFMISTAALSNLLGRSREAESRAARLQTEKGIGRFGEVNALAFLCGIVVVSRPVALHGVGDGVGCKARRIFDLFDLRQRGALNCHELSVCLLTLARALEAFLKLTEEGHVSELFQETDSKIYLGLAGLDRAAKLALRKWDAPDDYTSSEETEEDDEESQEKPEKILERERFVAWSRRLLAPGCRPPAVLDALRRLAKAAANNDRHTLGLPPESQAEAAAQTAHAQALIDAERAEEFRDNLIKGDDLPTTLPEPLFAGEDGESVLDPIARAFAEAAAEQAALPPPWDPNAGDVPPAPPHPDDVAASLAVDAALEAEGVMSARANASVLEALAKLFDEYVEEAVCDEAVDRCFPDLADGCMDACCDELSAARALDDAADRAVEGARLAADAASEASRAARGAAQRARAALHALDHAGDLDNAADRATEGARLASEAAAFAPARAAKALRDCREAAFPFFHRLDQQNELDDAADRAVECARLASDAASMAARRADQAARSARDALAAFDEACAGARDDAAERAVECARLASVVASSAAAAAARAARDARDALVAFVRAEELMRQAVRVSVLPSNRPSGRRVDGVDAAPPRRRRHTVASTQAIEDDEQTWMSDLERPAEEARPATAAGRQVVDDYEEVIETEFTPPVHYKKKAQKHFLYEVFSSAPFCSHLEEAAVWVLVNACRLVKAEAKKVLLEMNTTAADMYTVDLGACDVIDEVPVDCKVHGQYYGEAACLKDEPLEASLVATDECITWALDAETLRRTVGPDFDLGEEVVIEKPKTLVKEVHYNPERPDMPPWVKADENLSPVPVEEEVSDDDAWTPPSHYKPRKISNWLYEVMAAAPFCDGIQDEMLDTVITAFAPLKAGPGFSLASQDNQPERFFVVEEGACVIDDEGSEVGVIRKDQYHGHEALLNYATERCTVTSSTDLKAWELDKETFLRLLGRKSPTNAQRIKTRDTLRDAAFAANEDLLGEREDLQSSAGKGPSAAEVFFGPPDEGDPMARIFSGPLSSVTATERLTLLLFGDLGSVDGVRQKADFKLRPATPHREVSRFERFASLVQLERDLAKKKHHVEPLLLLCGGAFAASVESGVTKGRHLVPILNELGVHAACVGARDFDYGLPNASRAYRSCNFPSLLANCDDNRGVPVADAMRSQLVPWHGRKIGIVGVAGENSLSASAATLPGAGPMHDEDGLEDEEVECHVSCAPEAAAREVQLLREAGADVVIVLASVGGGARFDEPGALIAKKCGGYADAVVVSGSRRSTFGVNACRYDFPRDRATWVIRAPANCERLARLRLHLPNIHAPAPRRGVQLVREVDLTTVAVGAGRATVLNRWRNGDAVATLVGKARDLVAKGLLATLVELRRPLDASTEALKGGRNLAQTSYGASAAEVAADVACAATAAECAIVDGAALRPLGELPAGHALTVAELAALAPLPDPGRDRSYPGGEAAVRMMKTTSEHILDGDQRPTTAYARDMRDVDEIKQMATHGAGVMVLEATGAQLWGALERALSRYPAYCDVFPHCSSGFQIWFDPSKPPGKRVKDVRLKGAMLQPRELYRVCVTPRLAYHCFLGADAPRGPADVVVDASDGPALPALLRNLFVDLDKLRADSSEQARKTLTLSPAVHRRLSAPGMPLVRRDGAIVLEPDGSNRLTLLNADKAVKRWGFEPSATPAEALGNVVAQMSPNEQRRIHRGLGVSPSR